MPFTELRISRFRILADVQIAPGSNLSLLVGPNGSGKTSLLESITLLASGRSFVPAQPVQLIQRGQPGLTVFARWCAGEGAAPQAIGFHLDREGARSWRVDGETVRRAADVAVRLPTFVLEANSQALVTGGPSERRRYLDRGLFHVEPGFHDHWLSYRKAVQQRNAALRQAQASRHLAAWEEEMAIHGEWLDQARRRYLDVLAPLAAEFSRHLGLAEAPVMDYRRGWPQGQGLADCLARGRTEDVRALHTSVGPHRADLRLTWGGGPAKASLSRGQVKRVAAAMVLAQAVRFRDTRGRAGILLLDDVGSELDQAGRRLLLAEGRRLGFQVFATATEEGGLAAELEAADRLFHVEQGQLRSMV